MFQIYSPKVDPVSAKSVLLLHGTFESSDNFIMNSKEKSIAFNLADSGYDVWLGNTRGNSYSLGHVSLDSSKDAEYWDHSWYEIAEYDLPAFIDRVLQNKS